MSDLVSFVLARVDEDEASITRLPDAAERARRWAECRAMRGLVDGGRAESGNGPGRDVVVPGRDVVGELLRALALPYAAHPEYLPEWRPGHRGASRPAPRLGGTTRGVFSTAT